MARTYVLERSQVVGRPIDEVFAFFADARNLERITPGFLRFRITSPDPLVMRRGALIDYRLELYGVGFGWKTRISEWEPGRRFVDVQLSGPYRRWEHTHTFTPTPEGTRVDDRVEYELPLSVLGDVAHRLFVRGALDRIFGHRRDEIDRVFSRGAIPQASAT